MFSHDTVTGSVGIRNLISDITEESVHFEDVLGSPPD